MYYGRIPNNTQNAGRCVPKQVFIDKTIIELPLARKFAGKINENKKLQERLKKSGKRMDERMVKNTPRYIKI